MLEKCFVVLPTGRYAGFTPFFAFFAVAVDLAGFRTDFFITLGLSSLHFLKGG